MKRVFLASISLVVLFSCIVGCDKVEEPTTYTIASKKGAYKGWSIGYEECYFFKENPDGKWFPVDNLYGLKYELGYEYVVEGRLLTGDEQFKQNMIADAEDQFTVTSLISKEKKDSEVPGYEYSIELYEKEFLGKE